MRYRYLDDFRRGISVFAIFSYGIAVLGTPQCPPRHEYDKYRPGSVSHTPSTTKTPGRPLYKKVKFYGRREHFVQWFCLLKCALLNVYQRFFYYVYVLWRVAGPGFYYSAGPVGQEIIIGPIMALGWAHQHAFNRRGLFTFPQKGNCFQVYYSLLHSRF